MPPLQHCCFAIAAVLALSGAVLSPDVGAQTTTHTPLPTAISWDCWLAISDPVSIRCIAAREGQPAPDQESDPLETVLLDHVHTLLHSGRVMEIEGVVLKNLQVLQTGSIWTIRIWNQPDEVSWLEDRPAILVRAVLCPRGVACNVLIARP